MNKKARILYLSAAPLDQDRLQSDMEFRRIFENLDSNYFEISSISKMKAADLITVLAKERPHIVHFSGHGSHDEIIFEDNKQASRFVQKSDVIEVFRHLSKKPRIVFLNACWTAENLDDLSSSVDFVIATRNTVFDPPAIEFAAKFYELIGHGQPIKNAFDLAKTHFKIVGSTEYVVTYELFIRDGAKDPVMIKSPSEKPKKNRRGESTGKNVINITGSSFGGNTNISQGNKFGGKKDFE